MTDLTTTKNHLTVPELTAAAKLNLELRPFIENRNSPKVYDIDAVPAIQFIRDQVQLSMQRGGATNTVEQAGAIASVATGVYEYVIRSKYKHITLSEMADAFLRGGAGEYDGKDGKLFGFGVDRFTRCIRGYMESSSREAAMKEWVRQIEAPRTDKPVADLFKVNLAIAESFFELFDPEKSKMYDTVHAHENNVFHLPSLYDFLHSNFLFYPMPDEKEGIVKTAKIAYNEYIKKSGLQKSNPKQWEALVDSVKVGVNKTFDGYVKAEALKFCFAKLKSRNKTLKDLKKK